MSERAYEFAEKLLLFAFLVFLVIHCSGCAAMRANCRENGVCPTLYIGVEIPFVSGDVIESEDAEPETAQEWY
jgi:hypothetical protein